MCVLWIKQHWTTATLTGQKWNYRLQPSAVLCKVKMPVNDVFERLTRFKQQSNKNVEVIL